MKKLCLILATVGLLFSCQETKKNESAVEAKKDALEIIHARKSVREYAADKQISKEDLETIIRAGMAAPSARNIQPWHFVVVSEPAVMQELAEKLPYAKMLSQAPLAMVVCGDTTKSSYWYVDCSAVTENILLAVEALDLGAVWTAAYPYNDRMNVVVENLNLPENILPLAVIPMGYPQGEQKSKDKYEPAKIHYNKW